MEDARETRVAPDATFGGSKGFDKDGTVGNGVAVKLGTTTTGAVFGSSEGSGVCDW